MIKSSACYANWCRTNCKASRRSYIDTLDRGTRSFIQFATSRAYSVLGLNKAVIFFFGTNFPVAATTMTGHRPLRLIILIGKARFWFFDLVIGKKRETDSDGR